MQLFFIPVLKISCFPSIKKLLLSFFLIKLLNALNPNVFFNCLYIFTKSFIFVLASIKKLNIVAKCNNLTLSLSNLFRSSSKYLL